MIDDTDQELVERYRKGDVEALGILVERYRRPLYSVILNMTGSSTAADDVFQDVWFRAIRRLRFYRHENLLGWLIRIARNLVIDRSRRRKGEISLDQESEEGHPLVEALPGTDSGPLSRLADTDLGRRIAVAVEQLPAEQQAVFRMRVQGGVPFKEIARGQGVSINTALARMHYAIGKLRVALEADYAELARQ